MARTVMIKQSASALLHPLSLTAILVLLLNDHLLRRFWPSWITGKLGDFAWLFFFPLVVLLLLSYILPPRWRWSKNLAALASFGLVGGVFVLAKTVPACNALLVRVLESILNMPVSLHRDSTDLVALPALLAAWLLWRHAPRLPARRLRRAWLVASLAVLLTVANSAPYRDEIGVTGVTYQDGRLLAVAAAYPANHYYTSPDGGESWQPVPEDLPRDVFGGSSTEGELSSIVEIPGQPGRLLRYNWFKDIEISSDGGQTWQIDHALNPSQAQKAIKTRLHSGLMVRPVAWAMAGRAAADPSSQNVVFAMGNEGVLLRRPDGSYRSAAVGPYAPLSLIQPGAVWSLVNGEFWLGIILGAWGVALLGWRWQRHWLLKGIVVILGIGWALLALVIPPALQTSYLGAITGLAAFILGILILPFTLDTFFITWKGSPKHIAQLILFWLACLVFYFIPFILWSQDILAKYYLAAGIGILLSVGFLAWRYQVAGRWFTPEMNNSLSGVGVSTRGLIYSGMLMLFGIILALLGMSGVVALITFGLLLFALGYIVILGYLIKRWMWINTTLKQKDIARNETPSENEAATLS